MLLAVVFLLCLVPPHFLEAGEWSGPKWNEQNCGVSKYEDASDGICFQVINGCKAREHEFPWAVYIEYFRGSTKFACGGTIISECYVLTAAHCLLESGDLIPADKYTLFIGEHERNDGVVLETRVGLEVMAHPDYDTVTNAYDIGLIRLNIPLVFNENIKAICKPVPDELYANEVGVVAGWGHFDNSGGTIGVFSDELRFGNEDIFDPADCPEPYQDPKYICMLDKDANPQSPCFGDSGGALMVKEFPSGTFRQVGVISFVTSDICKVGAIQGITRITQATLDWIEEC